MRNLRDLKIGEKGIIVDTDVHHTQKRRILDLGIIENTEIEAVFKSPSGDPVAYNVRGAIIAIRSEDAEKIYIM